MHLKNTLFLFIDTVGYSGIQAADQSNAQQQKESLETILKDTIESHRGRLLQVLHESALATFEKAPDALACAKTIQEELPLGKERSLRLGLHQGEVEIQDEQVTGKGVLEVSQLVHLGETGSIVLSKNILSQLPPKDQSAAVALGKLPFQNQEEPLEVFSFPAEPIAAPKSSPPNQSRWSRALKVFAGYLVASWTILQFVDWMLTRYQISPYWTDILLWTFIGIIPSLLIYLVNQERINQKKLLRREKIIIPLNLLLLFGGLTVAYGKADLGSITQSINFTDENGQTIARKVIKKEFRVPVTLFPFEQEEGPDSTRSGWNLRSSNPWARNYSRTNIYLLPIQCKKS